MSKKNLTILIIVGAAVIIACIKFLGAPKILSDVDLANARSKGNPQGKVKITEFIDFECPACANGVKILKTYFDAHADQMYITVKYFPLTNMHRHAIASALYSECAARQGKFWQLNDLMMPQQASWSQLLSADPVFQDMARDAGIDIDRLNACMSSDDAHKVINDEKSLGQSLGVQSTPTYFINGKMVVGTKSLQEELDTYFPSK